MRTHFMPVRAAFAAGLVAIFALVAIAAGADQPQQKNTTSLQRASELLGLTAWDAQNNKLGKVKDLIIDPKTKQVQFVIVSHGFLERDYAVVPIGEMQLQHDPKTRSDYFLASITPSQLRDAPKLPKNDWTALNDSQFVGKVQQFYQRIERTAARPVTDGMEQPQHKH